MTEDQLQPVVPAASAGESDRHLDRYRKADPDLRRLIEAELQRDYYSLRWPYILRMGGLISGFIVAIVGLVLATIIILNDHAAAGTIFAGADFTALVGIFVLGDKWRRDHRNE